MNKYKVSRQRAYWCTETAIIEAECENEAWYEFEKEEWEGWVEIDELFSRDGLKHERAEEIKKYDKEDSHE